MRIRHNRRPIAIVLGVAMLLGLVVSPLHAAIETVSGTLVFGDPTELSPDAVAVVTLFDRSPDGKGTLIGQQRIDGASGEEIPFAVAFERDAIDDTHAYSVAASIVDGDQEWSSPEPIPTITGGPTDGLEIELALPEYTNPAEITGTVEAPAGTVLSEAAVAYVAIFNDGTGRLVSRQTIISPQTFPISFTVGYDADLLDPEATYVAAAGVIDGALLLQTESTTPIDPSTPLSLGVVQRPNEIPVSATPAPSTGEASATPAATGPAASGPAATEPAATEPAAPTPPPAETPVPPVATPIAPATPTPPQPATATPGQQVTPAPTQTSPATPAASLPTPAPPVSNPTSVSGVLVYRERAALSPAAVAYVAAAQVGTDGAVVVVGTQTITNPGPVPIAFNVPLDTKLLDTSVDTLLFALIQDADRAWETRDGVPVATNDAPSEGVVAELTFQPDLIEGQVTGITTGAAPDLSTDSVAMTWLLDASTLAIIGFDVNPAEAVTEIPFEVPFAVSEIEPGKDYVAESFVYDVERTWATVDGTPVVTNGNPLRDVVVTVAQVTPLVTPGPSVSAASSVSAVPSGTPGPRASSATTPPTSTDSGTSPIVWLILIVAVAAAVVIIWMRRGQT